MENGKTVEEKMTAVYLMVRLEELTPGDNGSYEGPLAKQKEECLQFLNTVVGEESAKPIEIYTSITQMLIDVERGRIKQVVVREKNRLGATPEDVEGVLFELRSGDIPVLAVME
jgi:hypothetical protein